MKQILRYPGGKWRLADWIISFFPEHKTYCEPFFGGGAIFFNKPSSYIETINDIDGNKEFKNYPPSAYLLDRLNNLIIKLSKENEDEI